MKGRHGTCNCRREDFNPSIVVFRLHGLQKPTENFPTPRLSKIMPNNTFSKMAPRLRSKFRAYLKRKMETTRTAIDVAFEPLAGEPSTGLLSFTGTIDTSLPPHF
jgi:hypothetical protein